MRISIDERDVTNILDLEYYIKERKYALRWKEFLILVERAKLFDLIDVQYHKINEVDFFDVVWIFQNGESQVFECWSRVARNDMRRERHRKMKKNIEDIYDLTSLYYYLNERCFLLNSREFSFLALQLQKWNNINLLFEDCKLEKVEWKAVWEEKNKIFIPPGINVENQVAGHYYMYFKQKNKKIKLDAYTMHYDRFARERRRENV